MTLYVSSLYNFLDCFALPPSLVLLHDMIILVVVINYCRITHLVSLICPTYSYSYVQSAVE